MERWVKRTIELGTGLVFTGKSNPSVIPYYPQKTEISKEENLISAEQVRRKKEFLPAVFSLCLKHWREKDGLTYTLFSA